MQNRQLAAWLTEYEYESFESDWESQQQIRDTQNTDSRLMSKREVKIATVEVDISALIAVEVANPKERKEQDTAKLGEFLKSPFFGIDLSGFKAFRCAASDCVNC